ncbi:excinuclease ABC subunit A [Paenibacillus rhizosphaerae]|uniref:UvrABC system protein A n=1 Tax=Paenibacillus rhizosphaerae TaxID=297318 RepID=A0A839TTY0_9BACL|nr:excinuclease ABC subunit UvrA [Paenibacillus rhizosphaerae]MBB3130001.1 excinuclease ABC subunit A [Paenibacillus rhizosphaerae]
MDDYIEIEGAREHNLKNISLRIPKRKLVVLTGLSGSGKSSLAMDTLQKECQRQYMESMGMVTDFISKPRVDSIRGLSPSISVSQHVTNRNPRSTVGTVTEIYTYLRVLYAKLGVRVCPACSQNIHPVFEDTSAASDEVLEPSEDAAEEPKHMPCPHCHASIPKLTMAHFSFNKPEGACATCTGIGIVTDIAMDQLLQEDHSILEGGVTLWDGWVREYYADVLLAASKHYGFPYEPHLPIRNYDPIARDMLLYGAASEQFQRYYPGVKPPKSVAKGNFEGLVTQLLRKYREHDGDPEGAGSKKGDRYFMMQTCPDCRGSRLGREGRLVTIQGTTIIEAASFTLLPLYAWLKQLEQQLTGESLAVWEPVFNGLADRIQRLIDVGLEYLSLDRKASTLSGGEAQRLRLASLLGSGLTGVLYVLDEPTAGLHPRDTHKLIRVLKRLRDLGNTVLAIEHDTDVMKAADHLIEIGPGSGKEGGTVVGTGTIEQLKAIPDSATGRYLREMDITGLPVTRRAGSGSKLTIEQASAHNLKRLTVSFPLGCLITVTGVSGSGKSTLLFDILEPAAKSHLRLSGDMPGNYERITGLELIDKVIAVDQAPIGKISRSNIATYTDLFTPIRSLFADLPEARKQRLSPKHFSFNTPGGRCEKCRGMGTLQLDMHFLPDVEVRCPVCLGKRFTEVVLAVKYKGFSISDILNQTVLENAALFEEPVIADMLNLLSEVGLGYLQLGQPTTTLSGGEAQRIKLAKELGKKSRGHTLYLLDEPTTGLHPSDVRHLCSLLNRLVDAGNTVIVIEHHLELMAASDWIADFGPEGGDAGGQLIAQGTPEEVAAVQASYTGRYLAEHLSH